MSLNQANNKTLLPGQEYPEKNEDIIAAKLIKLLEDQMLMIHGNNKQQSKNQQKMKGFVKAEI